MDEPQRKVTAMSVRTGEKNAEGGTAAAVRRGYVR